MTGTPYEELDSSPLLFQAKRNPKPFIVDFSLMQAKAQEICRSCSRRDPCKESLDTECPIGYVSSLLDQFTQERVFRGVLAESKKMIALILAQEGDETAPDLGEAVACLDSARFSPEVSDRVLGNTLYLLAKANLQCVACHDYRGAEKTDCDQQACLIPAIRDTLREQFLKLDSFAYDGSGRTYIIGIKDQSPELGRALERLFQEFLEERWV